MPRSSKDDAIMRRLLKDSGVKELKRKISKMEPARLISYMEKCELSVRGSMEKLQDRLLRYSVARERPELNCPLHSRDFISRQLSVFPGENVREESHEIASEGEDGDRRAESKAKFASSRKPSHAASDRVKARKTAARGDGAMLDATANTSSPSESAPEVHETSLLGQMWNSLISLPRFVFRREIRQALSQSGRNVCRVESEEIGCPDARAEPQQQQPRSADTAADRAALEASRRATSAQPSVSAPRRVGFVGYPSDDEEEYGVCDQVDVVTAFRRWSLKFSGGGSCDPDSFLVELTKCQNVYDLTDNDVLEAISITFSGRARLWCLNNEYNWSTLDDFIDDFRLEFCIPIDRSLLYQELRSRTQAEGERLNDYITAFQCIIRRFDPRPSVRKQIVLLKDGLHPVYSEFLARKKFSDLHELKRVGREIERMMERQQRWQPPPAADEMLVPEAAYQAGV